MFQVKEERVCACDGVVFQWAGIFCKMTAMGGSCRETNGCAMQESAKISSTLGFGFSFFLSVDSCAHNVFLCFQWT